LYQGSALAVPEKLFGLESGLGFSRAAKFPEKGFGLYRLRKNTIGGGFVTRARL
jgi:hypothetical protein